ncbi:ABC transporter ATP-binding protein [Magnetospirillum fulvum]|uniref:Peptide ABC transporter ATPase n=1 Tax=Magnetospirillum fulvum MGU-K5 TaxID=1316936 RepID=S9TWD9_MAGFU|nr:ABC transporter ATP-binding protein [Magnetospirillum fulvum]EPY02720.1 peptide ABC transporter ATPase [Magnetospirillum fulvum MGU-K5]
MSKALTEGLRLSGIRRRFSQGKDVLDVLRGADLEIQSGEIVALVGPSGAGKSTLLHIAGLLEHPDQGEVFLAGISAGDQSEAERTRLRRLHLGFVYQFHHLLPEFSAVENVILPQMIAGIAKGQAREKAMDLLDRMGLANRADHRPGQLSGGEQQRVAICRALANGPRVLLADEPTGNLDPHTAESVFAELIALVRGTGVAALIATHNPDLAQRMDRVVTLRDGQLVAG